MSASLWREFLNQAAPTSKPEALTEKIFGIPFVVDPRVPPWASAILVDPVTGDVHVMRRGGGSNARLIAATGAFECHGEAWTLRGVALKDETCVLSLLPIAPGDFVYAPADPEKSSFPDMRIHADAIAEIRISFLKRPEA